MSFATIAGVTYAVQRQGTNEDQREEIGKARRTFDGSARSSIKVEKRNYSMLLAPILPAVLATLETNIALGIPVACNGAFSGGVARNYIVRITSCGYFEPNQTTGMMRVPTVSLMEV